MIYGNINELNLIKTEGVNKRFKYITANSSTNNVSAQMINLFKQITVSMTYANNLIVIKTLGGNASSAGMAVDAMHFPQVLGTVAGDDTLLVVTKNNSDAEVVLKSLRLL
jgi:transcriptional regulator of arginine metabolism